VLPVGPAPAATVTTELHVGPAGEGPGPEVHLLTERGAERRVALAGDDPGRAELMRRIEEDAGRFGFGATFPLDEYRARGGSLTVDGRGAALVERVVRPVPARAGVPAGGPRAVLVDVPGRRPGGLLEDIVHREQAAAADVVLEVVVPVSGPPPALTHVTGPRIVVLTRLDALGDLGDPRVLGELEDLVMSRTATGATAHLAVCCPPWAHPSVTAWREHHPDAAVWQRADASRARWAEAAWPVDGPTGGVLRAAVEAAMTDGGLGRLRLLLAGAMAAATAAPDPARLGRAVAAARRHAEQVAASVPDTAEGRNRRDAVTRDQQPLTDVRDEARVQAALAVYGDGTWPCLRAGYVDDGTARCPAAELAGILSGLDLAGLARRAAAAFDLEVIDIMASWLGDQLRTGSTGGGPIGMSSGVVAVAADAAATPDVFACLGGGLVDHVARRPTGPPTFATIAQLRHELASLLERLLVERALPVVERHRWLARDARAAYDGDPPHVTIARGAGDAVRQLEPA
jgi:hypothetical protein